jgi:hypothetical protein
MVSVPGSMRRIEAAAKFVGKTIPTPEPRSRNILTEWELRHNRLRSTSSAIAAGDHR